MCWRLVKEVREEDLMEVVKYLGDDLFTYRAFLSLPFYRDNDKEIVREQFRERGWEFTEGSQTYRIGIRLEELIKSVLFMKCFHIGGKIDLSWFRLNY